MAFYDYRMLSEELSRITSSYPFIQKSTIGKSVQGRDIYAVGIGEGKQQVLFVGTHFASDSLICALLMRFVEDYAKHYVHGTRMQGYSLRNLYQRSEIYILPMVNPDGVEMSLKGFSAYEAWKANARGVDLEHNYDAAWNKGKKAEHDFNIFGPGPVGYGGRKPESEPESEAVANFIRRQSFQRLLSFQMGGGNIYWKYQGIAPPQSEAFALQMAERSGIKLSSQDTYGSCKDWFIKMFNKPGYTIEINPANELPPEERLEYLYKILLELFLISSII